MSSTIDPEIIGNITKQLKTRRYTDGSPFATFTTENEELAQQVQVYYLSLEKYTVERWDKDDKKPFLLIYPETAEEKQKFYAPLESEVKDLQTRVKDLEAQIKVLIDERVSFRRTLAAFVASPPIDDQ